MEVAFVGEYNTEQYQSGSWLEQAEDLTFLDVDKFLEMLDAGESMESGIKDPIDIYREIHREAEEIQTSDQDQDQASVPNVPSRTNTPFSTSFVDSPALPELASPSGFQEFHESIGYSSSSLSSSSSVFDGVSRDAFTPSAASIASIASNPISSRHDHIFVRQSPVEQGQKRRAGNRKSGAVNRRQELRERKKEQNREAATRYRLKKRAEKQTTGAELETVEMRNEDLKKQVQNLEQEIAYLKGLMGEVRSLKMKRSQ